MTKTKSPTGRLTGSVPEFQYPVDPSRCRGIDMDPLLTEADYTDAELRICAGLGIDPEMLMESTPYATSTRAFEALYGVTTFDMNTGEKDDEEP